MKTTPAQLSGALLLEPKVFKDPRGFFFETWQEGRYQEAGLPTHYVQDNTSYSSRGVLRGLHFQYPRAQGKLVTVLLGEIFDVIVDIRVGSPTFGKWEGFKLSSENNLQLWVPKGFAHGFCVTSEKALVIYKVTEVYHPEEECSVLWNDPDLKIDWPKLDFQLSAKDQKGKNLKEYSKNELPSF